MYANLIKTGSKSLKVRNASSKSGLFHPARPNSINDARKMIFSNSLMQRLASQHMHSSITPQASISMVQREFKKNIISPNFRTVPHITSGNANVLQRSGLRLEDISLIQKAIAPFKNSMMNNLSEIYELIDNMILFVNSGPYNRSLNYLMEIIRLCEFITVKYAVGKLSSIIPLVRSIYNSTIDELKHLKMGRYSVGPERHDRLDIGFSGPNNTGLEESKEYDHIKLIKCNYGDSPTNAQDNSEETKPGFKDRDIPKIDIDEDDSDHPPIIHIDESFNKKIN
jgi:hypothetical protein